MAGHTQHDERPAGPGNEQEPGEELSRWWRYGVLILVLAEFGVLAYIGLHAYAVKAPIPEQVVGPSGEVVFTGPDVREGQRVFQSHGLMDNGTVWGHGAYLGPDFAATYLHRLALDAANVVAEQDYGRPYDRLDALQQQAASGEVHALLARNRYDPATETLTFTEPEARSFREQLDRWRDYFADSVANRGLGNGAIVDPEELRDLTAFFAWAAWASIARVPGTDHSYTMNFPYDPVAGNGPSVDSVVWSALSLIALLAGTGAVLLAFGRFDYLGWRGERPHVHPQLTPGQVTPGQRATLKFFVVVAALFLLQVLVGGAVAHFRADPRTFYGVDLSAVLPSNLLRTWHLQLAIFWIATSFVAGGLFLASTLSPAEPKNQASLTNILFAALAIVVFGSLGGELLGLRQWLGRLWFWFGHQGWEYLELGRAWQLLLAAGLVLWAILLVRTVRPRQQPPGEKQISVLFLLAACAIPVFYLPAFFFGQHEHFTVVDTWRFWIIHLWVEGFFELFATVMVAVAFYKLGMVSRKTATRVIYLDAVLFLGSGILGTGHHWYWTGQTSFSLAVGATFSAMEVVPLILLTLDAWDFVKVTRRECDVCGQQVGFPHKMTFYFLIAVGVWNFVGAGVFGFLINLPIVSYYEAGTNLTPNHGHAALMGVFGMLAVALLVFALRDVSADDHWRRVSRYLKVSFWGLNIGLAGMVVLNLFPIGIMQLVDVVRNGYWHARSAEFLNRSDVTALSWLRLPADSVFILLGVVPLLIATVKTWRHARTAPAGEGS